MSDVNLADPAFEPSDEQLRELVRGAFAEVAANRKAVLAETHATIAVLRARALERIGVRR